MATLREEATALISILPNPGKYSEKLTALLAATENANAALADLKAAENAKATATAARLEQQENLLALLTAQSDEIANANAAAAASRVAAENDLARRVGELETAKQQHADEVARSLKMFAAREAELTAKQTAQDTDFGNRTKELRGVEDKLRTHHSGLRAIVASARQGIAVIAA